ncbi:MAG: alpha-1,2-fucosyltransferase [Bacteroidota bacterium]
MIAVKLEGRLGNQMFQYAFVYSNAKRNNTSFFLMKEGMPIELYKYFKLERNVFYRIDRTFFNNTSFKLFFSHYLRTIFYRTVKRLTIYKTIHIDNETLTDKISFSQNHTYYLGFFQSPIYFEDHASAISKLFEVKKSIMVNYKKKYKWMDGKTIVAVHIRKTDYGDLAHLNLGKKDLSLPLSYFQRVINDVYDESHQYVFVSDDIAQVKPHFTHLKNAFFSDDCAINDFLHIYFADQLIIANSTFSWWAAYLNKNTNKRIYCPKYFLGYAIKQEYPKHIYPADWIQVDVDDAESSD